MTAWGIIMQRQPRIWMRLDVSRRLKTNRAAYHSTYMYVDVISHALAGCMSRLPAAVDVQFVYCNK